MAKQYAELTDTHRRFIARQSVYFVGTAPREGNINLSPKGMDSLRVKNSTQLVWLNLTGSGNETAAHVVENGRMTLMFCSFEEQPLILRLFGQARVIHPRDPEWGACLGLFPAHPGPRQCFELNIDRVIASCGWGVPRMNLVEERSLMATWAEEKGPEGIEAYWREKNQWSIDGLPTTTVAPDA